MRIEYLYTVHMDNGEVYKIYTPIKDLKELTDRLCTPNSVSDWKLWEIHGKENMVCIVGDKVSSITYENEIV